MQQLIDARILVVDDENANVLLIKRILERAGYREVRSTTDPEAVLGLVEVFRPDLLLLDLKMPRMDGFQILELLGSATVDPYLPVLVLTADATREVRRRALAAGARDFLAKPEGCNYSDTASDLGRPQSGSDPGRSENPSEASVLAGPSGPSGRATPEHPSLNSREPSPGL